MDVTTEGADLYRTIGDHIVQVQRDWIEDQFRPRQGPRRQRVFLVDWDRQVPEIIRPWRDQLIELVEQSDYHDWDDLPDELLEQIGHWDWEYLPPRQGIPMLLNIEPA